MSDPIPISDSIEQRMEVGRLLFARTPEFMLGVANLAFNFRQAMFQKWHLLAGPM